MQNALAYTFFFLHPLPSPLVKMIYDHMLCTFFFFSSTLSPLPLPHSVQSPTLNITIIIIILFLRDENAFAQKRYNTRVCVSFSLLSDCGRPIFEQKSNSSLRRHSRWPVVGDINQCSAGRTATDCVYTHISYSLYYFSPSEYPTNYNKICHTCLGIM